MVWQNALRSLHAGNNLLIMDIKYKQVNANCIANMAKGTLKAWLSQLPVPVTLFYQIID